MGTPRKLKLDRPNKAPLGRAGERGPNGGPDTGRRPRVPAPPEGWKRPSLRRMLAIRDRLRELHGRPLNEPHGDPIAELTRTILSQNTNDRNRDVAYGRMRERFPSWEEVRDAPTGELVEALRPGGLAKTKAPRIQQNLRLIGDPPDLDWLERAPRDEAISYLTELPGVGRKTAACVLLFSFGRPDVPVDTHVYRVGGRLGLWPAKAPLVKAHDELARLVGDDGEFAYET
ncbi:MAG: endonuclease III domain-containing protein, partial [Solirubrobacterales bacterium]